MTSIMKNSVKIQNAIPMINWRHALVIHPINLFTLDLFFLTLFNFLLLELAPSQSFVVVH